LLITDDPEAIWEMPAGVTADDLEANLRLLKQYIDEPPSFEEGKTAADLLRRKVVRKETYNDSDESSISDSNDEGSSDGRHKTKKRRKRRELDEAEIEERRERRRMADLEKRAIIKSAVRIVDSDDDSDAEREFFEREKELRERMARKAVEGELPPTGTRKVRERKKKSDAVEMEPESVALRSDHDKSMDVDVTKPSIVETTSLSHGDDSKNDNTDGTRVSKRRKIRRAVNISSDEE